MDIKDHPCKDGLTAACFKKYPKWARKMFAYRLLLTLCPHEITKRLPQLKSLLLLLVPPDWPPSIPWPPVYLIDPKVVFPPSWTAGDPLPEGVTIPPGVVFPPGWTAGDPLPAGVTISPGAVFPPGWTAGDPLPAGVSVGIKQRPAILKSGVVGPLYVKVWEEGPPHGPTVTPVEGVEPWFHDPFDVLDPLVWTDASIPPATAGVSAGELILTGPGTGERAQVRHSFTTNYPGNFQIELKRRIGGNYYYASANGYTGVYRFGIAFYPQDPWIDLRYSGGWHGAFVPAFANLDIVWKLTVVAGVMNLYRDDVLVFGPLTPESNAALPARLWLEGSDSTIYDDYVTIYAL